MKAALYGELAPWYYLVDPTAEHAEETEIYRAALERGAGPGARTLLELGAGGGNNAWHLKQRFQCTLSDVSEVMLGLSRELNPDCEHLIGDMRTLRLGRTFDTVLVHDAVMYMTRVEELDAVAATAFAHTRPGGAALFAPDYVRETFHEATEQGGEDDGARGLRYLAWTWDPDPADDTYIADYVFLLREGDRMRAVHDRHTEGLFSKATWTSVLERAGYRVEPVQRVLGGTRVDEIFLCTRPAAS